MRSGGSRQIGDGARAASRSRTTLVIDALLTRGALLQETTTGPSGSEPASPWSLVSPVLRATAASLLGSHLHWLVATTTSDGPRSGEPVADDTSSGAPSLAAPSLVQDQVKILVRALDEDRHQAVVTTALDELRPWSGADVDREQADVITYAAALRAATAGQPADSPYLALAASAAELAAAIAAERRSRAPSPDPKGARLISPARPDRARPSCPPSR